MSRGPQVTQALADLTDGTIDMLMTPETVWQHLVLADGRTTAARPDRARQTIHRILAGSLGGLLVLVLTGYLLGARIAESQALDDARRLTEVVGRTAVGPHLTPEVVAGQPAALARLDQIVGSGVLRHSPIRRVKIWSPDGMVLYSNDPVEIGRSYTLEDDEQAVLDTGRSVASISDLTRAENVADRDLGPRMVEVYTALRSAHGRTVLFEAYLSYDEVQTRRTSVFTMLSILAIGLMGVFALFQVWLSAINLRWLRRRQAELKATAQDVSIRERRSLARDLHDGVVQELTGTAYLVDGARASLDAGDRARTEMLLDRVTDCVRSSVQALRASLIVVYPPSLADDGLGRAMEDLTQPLRTRGVEVTVADEVDRTLPSPVVEATYRAAQEAVRNIGRHAYASSASIRLFVERDRLCLVVRDNGVGLDVGHQSGLSRSGHLGLRALADAASELRGYLEVSTAPGRGTEIRWEIPL